MRESRTLEYKENLSSNTFLKTISAYANYGEGKIIFGINDQGTVIGITDPVNGCLNLENKINDSLSPVPEFRLEIQENTIDILQINIGFQRVENVEENVS